MEFLPLDLLLRSIIFTYSFCSFILTTVYYLILKTYYIFIHFPADGYLNCFQVKSGTCTSLYKQVSFSDKHLERELLGSRVCMFFVQMDVFKLKDSLLFLDCALLWQQMQFILLNDSNYRWQLLSFKKYPLLVKLTWKFVGKLYCSVKF